MLKRHFVNRRKDQDLQIPTSFLVDETGAIRKMYRRYTPVERVIEDTLNGQGSPLPFDYGHWYAGVPGRDLVGLAATLA